MHRKRSLGRLIAVWLMLALAGMSPALAQTYTLVSDLAFTGSATAPGTAGGNIGTSANWTGGYAAYQDITGSYWGIASGVLTISASSPSYVTGWALRPASEDALNTKIVGYTAPVVSGGQYWLLLRANRTAHTAYAVYFQQGYGLVVVYLNGSGKGVYNLTGFSGTVGTSYIITATATTVAANTTNVTISIAASTAPGTVLSTVTLSNDTSSGVQVAGSLGVGGYDNTSQFTRVITYTSAPAISFALSPTTATTGTPLTVTATGTGTSWTSGTTFSVAGGTGASISGLSITGQVATFTLNPGSAAGTLTISDSTDSATGTITVSVPSGLTAGTLSVPTSTASSISFILQAPSGGTAPYTAKVYRTSPAVPGFIPPGAGTQVGTNITAFPQTFTDSSPGSSLNSYKVLYSDSTGTPLTAVSLPAFGKVTAAAPLVLGFIGDSFDVQTPGFETSPTTCGNIIARLTGRNVTVVSQGQTGTTSANWIPGASPNYYGIAKAAFQAAGVTHIFIRIGINDASSTYSTPAATYQTNLQSTITQLQSDFPGVPIQLDYHSTPAPVTSSGTFPESQSFGLLLQYQAKINAIIAANTGVYLGDTQSWQFFAQHSDLLSDGLHPNADGMLYLAEFDAQAFLRNFFPGTTGGSGSKRKVQ